MKTVSTDTPKLVITAEVEVGKQLEVASEQRHTLAQVNGEIERILQQLLLRLEARHHHDVERDEYDGREEHIAEACQKPDDGLFEDMPGQEGCFHLDQHFLQGNDRGHPDQHTRQQAKHG